MNIQPIPAFTDNYIWLFHQPGSHNAYVVDPGDATAVKQTLSRLKLNLAGILITHHHFDHTGGIAELTSAGDIPVYGPKNSPCDQIDRPVSEGQRIELEKGITFDIIEVPGHTLDHIAFYHSGEEALFCGDTLFVGGCGRLFEGSPEQMLGSLEKLTALPSKTRVFCTHEYTLSNLAFAQAVEPSNSDISASIARSELSRQRDIPTVPSTIEAELKHNPFLRTRETSLITQLQARGESFDANSQVEIFAAVRAWKDHF